MNLKEIKELIEMIQDTDLLEFEYEKSGLRVRLRRGSPYPEYLPPHSSPLSISPQHTASYQQISASTVKEAEKTIESTTTLVTIESPMVGTFYRAPAPDADPYVNEGDIIKEGQILCIIEAMKLMNEIESKIAGKIIKILVENGQPVEYGQPLVLIEPKS